MTSKQINLSSYQIQKIKTAFNKRRTAKVRLRHADLINGKYQLILNDKQAKRIDKCIKEKTGLELELTAEQLQLNHSGGFLPLLFAGLGALGAILGGASSVANSVVDAKNKKAKLEEEKRHNIAMEKIDAGFKNVAIGEGIKKRNTKRKN